MSDEIISSLTAGLIVVGLDEEIRILNPAGRKMLGLPDDVTPEAVRRSLDELSLSEVIDECLRTAQPVVRRSVTLPEAHRGVSHVGVTVSPLFDDGAQLHGAICLFTDLTAVKGLEEQLRLKESLATVGELTAGIAHEFRNGLATIHGYSRLCRSRRAAAGVPAVCPGHSRGDGIARSGRHQLPELRASR